MELDIKNKEKIEKRKAALAKLPQYRGEIHSKTAIRQLPNVKVNEIFWIENDEKPVIVTNINKKKNQVTIQEIDENASISTGMTIYELNHNVISKEPLFDFEDEQKVTNTLNQLKEWFNKKLNQYFLLYSKDMGYFTLFNHKNKENEIDYKEIFEIIKDISNLISIDFLEDRIEIWIRTEKNPANLFYLFPFDNGIVEV